MNQRTQDMRVVARIPPMVKETLQKAAGLSGATLNQFLVQSALTAVNQILETASPSMESGVCTFGFPD